MYRKGMSLRSSLSEECDASNCSTSSSGYSGGESSASRVASILDRLLYYYESIIENNG